jgi:hypothetical protein
MPAKHQAGAATHSYQVSLVGLGVMLVHLWRGRVVSRVGWRAPTKNGTRY